MKLNTKSLNVARALCVVFAVSAISSSCLCQNAEQDPIFFNDDLQQVPMPSIAQPVLNLDMLQQQAMPRWHSLFTQIPGDFARFGNLTMSMQSVPTLAGLGLLTISLIETDHRTYHATRLLYRESATFREFSKYAVILGDGTLHAGIAAAFAGYGLIADDSRALTTASETAEAFLATGFTVQLLKHVTGRESPIAATRSLGRWKFFPQLSTYQDHQASYYSYPSGHISTATATLTILAENYPGQSWIKPVGYTMVGALGVGLVAKGMHWYSDLPLGLALGYIFGKTAAHPDAPDVSDVPHTDGVKVSVTPSFDSFGGSGVRFALNF